MKAFIAITLLAACVAAQTFDYRTTGLHNQRQNALLRSIFGVDKDITYDTLRMPTVPMTYETNVLTFDEIIRHPLFQVYYQLPLFRQHFSHPLFQVYLTTPAFQNLWTHPTFITFFRNPYLFNKYIYPVVYNTNMMMNTDNMDMDMTTKNIFGDYKTDSIYPMNLKNVHYTNMMDKIFKDLFPTKPEVMEVKTDVKVHTEIPVEKKTFGKLINPITREIKYTIDDVKTIDDKIVPVEKMTSTVDREMLLKEALRKYFLNKAITSDRNMEQTIPEILPIEKTTATVDREMLLKEALRKYFLNKAINGDRKLEQTIPETMNSYKYENIYPQDLVQQNEMRTPVFNKMTGDLINKYNTMPREFINEIDTMTPFVNKYEKMMTGDLFNKYNTMPRFVNKIDMMIPYVNNMMDRDLKYETVPRQFVNNYEKMMMTGDVMNKFETIPSEELITKYERMSPFFNKYEKMTPVMNKYEKMMMTRDLVNKYETIPQTFGNKYDQMMMNDNVMNKYETIAPSDMEAMKKMETEIKVENKLENILKEESAQNLRVRRDARGSKHFTYVPLTQTYGQQIYAVPTSQYIVGEQRQAQVPLTRTSQVSHYVPTYTYNTVPVTQQVYYPGQTYITA